MEWGEGKFEVKSGTLQFIADHYKEHSEVVVVMGGKWKSLRQALLDNFDLLLMFVDFSTVHECVTRKASAKRQMERNDDVKIT